MMKKWERLSSSRAMRQFSRFLPVICFILGCMWCTLFPFVSITTGETKPRGFFVDEHAILSGANFAKEVSFKERQNVETATSLDCSQFKQTLGQCCRTFNLQNRNITQIVVDSIYSPKSLESTVIVLRSYTGATHSLLANLVENLSVSNWLANRVIFLILTPQTGSQHLDGSSGSSSSSINSSSSTVVVDDMTVVDFWLRDVYSGRQGELSSFISSHAYGQREFLCGGLGLIRDAYIIDMSRITISKKESRLSYDALQLQSVGRNGATPNLDIISYPFDILKPPHLVTESSAGACQELVMRVEKLAASTATHAQANTLISSASPLVARMALPVLKTVVGQNPRREGPLCALLSYASTTLAGPSGLHALFIERNIDSISFQLLPSTSSGKPKTKKQQQLQERTSKDLFNFVYKLIFVSSSLHEELHHSLHSYLLIGNDSFVGMNEYGPALLLLLSSLLFIVLKLTEVQFISERDCAAVGKSKVSDAKTSFLDKLEIGIETISSLVYDLLPLAFVLLIMYPSITLEQSGGDNADWTFNDQLLAGTHACNEEDKEYHPSYGLLSVVCKSKYTLLSMWKSVVMNVLQVLPVTNPADLHVLLLGTAMVFTTSGIFFRCKRMVANDDKMTVAISISNIAGGTDGTPIEKEENKPPISTFLNCSSMTQYSSAVYCIVNITLLLVVLCWLCAAHPSLGILCAVISIPGMLFINYGLQYMLQQHQLSSAQEKETRKSKMRRLLTLVGFLGILVLFNPLIVHIISQIVVCDFGEACTSTSTTTSSSNNTETLLPIAFLQSWLEQGSFTFPAIYTTTYIVMCTATQLVVVLLLEQ